MPLYNYECEKCNKIIEKFSHTAIIGDIKCECGEIMGRVFGTCTIRSWTNAGDYLKNKINPDAERIRNNIKNGKDKDFTDVYGGDK